MDSIVVKGNGPLSGQIPISGAKNTCLKLITAALLTDEPLTLTNVPRLSDIRTLSSLLTSITNRKADYEIVRKLRASFNVLGPLLAREGEAIVSLPGGCAIGARKVDLHMMALEKLGEMGTFMIAPAIAGGEVELLGGRLDLIGAFAEKLDEAGVDVSETPKGLLVRRRGDVVKSVDVTTQPYPGFPTDLQAQFMALMCTASGTSVLEETIFENRFMHAPELIRMGAKIDVQGGTATVTGVERLKGAPVMATDLRASVSLILAGLAAEGETVVNRVYHLDRGYERIEEKLSAVGAHIERVNSSD
ncbi:UNVERIFIED_CONTAM: hypothetical protein GTU68_049085 [Idotea baltica]|nr:hypothetical protein [Idotea baltica]